MMEKKNNMATGIVKWFNNDKGFGFITPDEGGADVFAHYQAIIDEQDHKYLKVGQKVSFDLVDGPKGPSAASIVPGEHRPGLLEDRKLLE